MKSILTYLLFFILISCTTKTIESSKENRVEEATNKQVLTLEQNTNSSQSTILSADYIQTFNHLFELRNTNKIKPKIELSFNDKNIAVFYPLSNKICVDDKAIKICKSFGKDSLAAFAFIVGHELSHFFENSDNTSCFVSDKSEQVLSLREANADIQGYFLTCISGKEEIRNFFPSLLERLYSGYHLDKKKLKGYPTKSERKNSFIKVKEKADSLYQIFQMATFALISGNPVHSEVLFQSLIQSFSTEEIYNNLAVSKMENALQLFPKVYCKYKLPFEIMTESRLDKARGLELTEEEENKIYSYLLDAKEVLNEGIKKFPYSDVLQKNLIYCRFLLKDYNPFLNSSSSPDILLCKSWMFLNNKDTLSALNILSKLEKSKDINIKNAAHHTLGLCKNIPKNMNTYNSNPFYWNKKKFTKIKSIIINQSYTLDTYSSHDTIYKVLQCKNKPAFMFFRLKNKSINTKDHIISYKNCLYYPNNQILLQNYNKPQKQFFKFVCQ